MPRIECLDSFRRPDASEQLFARDLVHVRRKQCAVEVGPEPGNKEHHLRGYEEDNSVALRDLHDLGVKSSVGRLARYVPPPAEHGIERAEHTDTKQVGRANKHMMHPGDAANRCHEERYRAHGRPWTWVHQVIIVVRFRVRISHFQMSPSPRYVYRNAFSFDQQCLAWLASRAAAPDTWCRRG